MYTVSLPGALTYSLRTVTDAATLQEACKGSTHVLRSIRSSFCGTRSMMRWKPQRHKPKECSCCCRWRASCPAGEGSSNSNRGLARQDALWHGYCCVPCHHFWRHVRQPRILPMLLQMACPLAWLLLCPLLPSLASCETANQSPMLKQMACLLSSR